MLKWEIWKPYYREIVSRLNLDSEADHRATQILHQLLVKTQPEILLSRLKALIEGNDVVVCGAGPSLHRHLRELEGRRDMSHAVYIAADGASSAFLEMGKTCDIIVTDLDGNKSDLANMIQEGALAIVHGHGDNIQALKAFVPRILPVLGSTQVEPTSKVFLWGGFTDGDRACFIVSHYCPKRVLLAGMDFGGIVGRWSKPQKKQHFKADATKQAKLDIAEQLINNLQQQTNVEYTLLK